jgi:hypothetical protein
MENKDTFSLILDQWRASLRSKNRKKDNIRPNFEELFQNWSSAGASFDDLYEDLLPKAISAHQPHSSVIRETYRALKASNKRFNKTEKELTEEWNKGIHDLATETFFEFFKPPSFDQDDEPKVYGSMSLKEYRAQRRYAEQFPTIKTDNLVKQWHDNSAQNLDIEEMIKSVLGDENEDNG